VKWAALLAQLCLAGVACAGQADAIRTCYNQALPASGGAPDTELFVAIDQTTPLDTSLKQLVADNVRPFLAPNHGFTLVTFSAYTQGHYTEVIAAGSLDRLLTPEQRNDVSKPVLLKFDLCTQRQPQQAAQMVGDALRSAYNRTSSDIAKSDVLASLKSISALVQGSKAKNKVVLLVSDMLENSSISSFYADKGHAVRKIDAKQELELAEKNDLLADFGGARVYVIGAGLLGADGKNAKAYRDPKTMTALAGFWSAYLNKSNARLVEFGQPALLRPVQ
jgi:hypothetical protein